MGSMRAWRGDGGFLDIKSYEFHAVYLNKLIAIPQGTFSYQPDT